MNHEKTELLRLAESAQRYLEAVDNIGINPHVTERRALDRVREAYRELSALVGLALAIKPAAEPEPGNTGYTCVRKSCSNPARGPNYLCRDCSDERAP